MAGPPRLPAGRDVRVSKERDEDGAGTSRSAADARHERRRGDGHHWPALARQREPAAVHSAHFIEQVEGALSRLLTTEAFAAVQGCDDAQKYEAAYQARGCKP